MIDIKNYLNKKENNLVNLVKIEDGVFAIYFKKWNSETGEQLPAEVQGLTLDELNNKKIELQKEMDELNVLINDCGIL